MKNSASIKCQEKIGRSWKTIFGAKNNGVALKWFNKEKNRRLVYTNIYYPYSAK